MLRPAWLPAVAVLVGGVLLHSMNVLMLATVLPSVVDNLGGATLMSWTSSAFLASSIVAATCTGYLTSILGARTVFCTGAAIFGLGALTCALAPTMGQVVAGRFVQGFGGGLLTAMAYVLVRSTFPETPVGARLRPAVGRLEHVDPGRPAGRRPVRPLRRLARRLLRRDGDGRRPGGGGPARPAAQRHERRQRARARACACC